MVIGERIISPWHTYTFCEPPYFVTKYIGEYQSTISNLGFIIVGLQYWPDPIAKASLVAGSLSIISHTNINLHQLYLDHAGLFILLHRLFTHRQRVMNILLNSSWAQFCVVAVGITTIIDLLTRYKLKMRNRCWVIYPHALWHLCMSYTLYSILYHSKE